ncbi:hypothetical protein HNQ51_002476 [Inhella inkyongensis]|uniref:Dipeptidyl-peptidase n=1 Tax=Inhella inkyongensis TaxID=392593 RepID=A0A840S1W8_9BURK|nr:S46 family peptidase [Inhella inkyongensis]MBB5205157.1 hypothetical protein [Inhella inkyongensis]
MTRLTSRTALSARLTPLCAAALALATFSAHAAEGMWMPQQMPAQAKALKAAGLKLDPTQLAKLTEFPLGAVVQLPGCTGSFVSGQGLVVTNHHCAYGSIQHNSTAERDLLKNGFLAKNLAEELPAAPGTRVAVTVDVRDVTAEVLDSATRALSGEARSAAIEARQKALVAACEQDAGHRCSVSNFYGGALYQLRKQLELRDVRLVHAPANGVGLFGGETDNWVWPRHTGDYSFYRAYVGPDGKPADYSPNNKPYAPKQVLKISQGALNEGDFVMVPSYPGTTNRHRLPTEVAHAFDWEMPTLVKAFDEQLQLIHQATAGRRDAEIRQAGRVQGLGNGLNNWRGQLKSYAGSDILARKQADYAALQQWVAAEPKRQAEFGAAFERIEALLKQSQAVEKRELAQGFATPGLLTLARDLLEQAHQRQLPDAQRKPGFQDRDLPRRKQRLQSLERRFDEITELKVLEHTMGQLLALPAEAQNPALLQALGLQPGMDANALRERLKTLHAETSLARDSAERMAWLSRSPAEFAQSRDPFIAAAVALYADDRAREAQAKALAGDLQQARSTLMRAKQAFAAAQGRALYPDANSTLRISHGQVAGRPGPDGAHWSAFSTLRGITEKHQGKGDFDAPAAQLEAIKARRFDRFGVKALDSVPVNFLATLDTTGGSSGSPVLNGKGELVGLCFDGTSDAVISDWDFNPKTTRTIVVDARYMQWQMKVVDKAEGLLKEMGAQ